MRGLRIGAQCVELLSPSVLARSKCRAPGRTLWTRVVQRYREDGVAGVRATLVPTCLYM